MQNKKMTLDLLIFFIVKADMSKAPIPTKIIRARRVISMMTGNANYPSPSPSMAEVKAKTDGLEAAEAAMDGSKLKTEQRDIALAAFMAVITQSQADVENVANGNVEKILTSGFEVRNPNTKPVILAAPTQVTLKNLSNALGIKWKANRKSKLNVVEFTTNPEAPATWESAGVTTKSRFTATNLVPGKQYYFRVSAINPAGQSEWSDVVGGIPNF